MTGVEGAEGHTIASQGKRDVVEARVFRDAANQEGIGSGCHAQSPPGLAGVLIAEYIVSLISRVNPFSRVDDTDVLETRGPTD